MCQKWYANTISKCDAVHLNVSFPTISNNFPRYPIAEQIFEFYKLKKQNISIKLVCSRLEVCCCYNM